MTEDMIKIQKHNGNFLFKQTVGYQHSSKVSGFLMGQALNGNPDTSDKSVKDMA